MAGRMAGAMLEAGGTIGILGGGQLGRMLAMAAARLGYRAIGYAPAGDNVAGDVCADFVTAEWDDAEALARFAARCDIVTWEFENVPVACAARFAGTPIHPHPRALETAQDRLAEKRFVEELGGRPAPFAPVDDAAQLADAIARIGAPGILKTRRDGYDGKGQWRIDRPADAAAIALPDRPLIYEGFVTFDAEFSVILARGADGACVFYDSTENRHSDGVLAASIHPPCAAIAAQMAPARALARRVADTLDYVGVLTCEFFATAAGPVFNEMAPRVHNSGHWTIEGAATCQFENHIRAICGLPLGDPATVPGRIAMENILGDPAAMAAAALADPAAHLHLYGKAQARPGRKMGHVTRIAWA